MSYLIYKLVWVLKLKFIVTNANEKQSIPSVIIISIMICKEGDTDTI